jgi:glycosidase
MMVDRALSEINIKVLTDNQSLHPSPLGWEDQVFYFMMLDRFSDGRENQYRDIDGNLATDGTTPLLQPTDRGNAIVPEASASKWREAGGKYVGGNLRGLTSKIGYLKRLGVTTIWVSPILSR